MIFQICSRKPLKKHKDVENYLPRKPIFRRLLLLRENFFTLCYTCRAELPMMGGKVAINIGETSECSLNDVTAHSQLYRGQSNRLRRPQTRELIPTLRSVKIQSKLPVKHKIRSSMETPKEITHVRHTS